MEENEILIYTDGAVAPKNPGSGGAAAIIKVNGIYICCAKYCGNYITNNRAELDAIELALRQVRARGLHETHNVRLYSDSVYALKVISGKNKAKKNVKIVKKIQKMIKTFPEENYRMFWVRGHKGNVLNEAADAMAKIASINPDYKWIEEVPSEEFEEKLEELKCQK